MCPEPPRGQHMAGFHHTWSSGPFDALAVGQGCSLWGCLCLHRACTRVEGRQIPCKKTSLLCVFEVTGVASDPAMSEPHSKNQLVAHGTTVTDRNVPSKIFLFSKNSKSHTLCPRLVPSREKLKGDPGPRSHPQVMASLMSKGSKDKQVPWLLWGRI